MMGDLKYGSYTPSRSPTVEIIIDYAIGDLQKLCRSVLEQDFETSDRKTQLTVEAMEVDGVDLGSNSSFTNHNQDSEVKAMDRLAKTGLYRIHFNRSSKLPCPHK